jgi:hypothetical protein
VNDEAEVPGRGGRDRIGGGAGNPRRHAGDPGDSGSCGDREKRRAKLVSAVLTAGLITAVAVGMTGCSTNPHSPDISAPPTTADSMLDTGSSGPAAQPQGHHQKPVKPGKQGINLPNTITLAYDRTPTFPDLPHHIVLWNANQALRAELAASYQKDSAATSDLRRYWTGPGYTQAYDWAQAWIDTKSRPVGRVVVSAVSVDSLTNLSATVSYCQDMSAVIRGDALTHTGGKALQPPHSDGEHVVMTLVPTGTKGLWQVAGVTVQPASASCPPSAEHRSKLA